MFFLAIGMLNFLKNRSRKTSEIMNQPLFTKGQKVTTTFIKSIMLN